MVPVFQNVGKRSAAKNYHPVSLLTVVSKVFKKIRKFVIESFLIA